MTAGPSAAHIALCDLLSGREMRMHAERQLRLALWFEAEGMVELVLPMLDLAARSEWFGGLCEQGKVAHGQRINRCGTADSGGAALDVEL